MSTHEIRKLQLGAGQGNLPGWLNTDIDPHDGQCYLDVAKPFPLPDRSFQYVFSEQLLEHFDFPQGLAMLRECHRILVPGGTIRIATPNLLRFVALFESKKPAEIADYMRRKLHWHGWPQNPTPECFILNLQLREFGHRFVYDPATLRRALEQAGFDQPTEFASGQSDDPELRGIEFREKSSIRTLDAYETMVFQAAKR